MGASAPEAIKRLVEHFDRDRKVLLSPDYKEEQLRLEFLNPFFECLGWDVSNKHALSGVEGAGLTGACPERSRRVAGATKAPDYTFRIGGRRVFAKVTTLLGREEQRSDASDTSDLSFQSLLSLLSLPSLLRSASRA